MGRGGRKNVRILARKGDFVRKFVLKVVICVLGIYFVISIIKPNVMDEIGERKIYGLIRVPGIEKVHDSWEWMLWLETMGAFDVNYQTEYLREGVSEISLWFYDDENDIHIYVEIVLSESDKVVMRMGAYYDCEKKELIYEPVYILQGDSNNPEEIIEEYIDETIINEYLNRYGLTRKDVQKYQDYAIYGVVVKTWTKAHRESYWIERWKLKSRVIDNTFRFDEESYTVSRSLHDTQPMHLWV